MFAGTRCDNYVLWRVRVFQTCSRQEGNKIFSGGADNAGRMFDVTTGQATQVAQHDAPIKVVRWIDVPGSGLLATGSWDKTIKVCAFCVHSVQPSMNFLALQLVLGLA